MFTLGGSWSGGVGGKDGELWQPESGWRSLSNVKSAGSLLTQDKDGVFVAE